MARLSWVALKPLLHTTRIFFSWHCRGTSYHIFSLCVSLLALRLSSSLCFAPANTRLPPRNIFRALFPIFFHQGYERERGRGGNRWIKRGNTMKREWDTVLRQWHWQRALSNVQGNKIGSYCRRTLICILFCVLFCPLFFCWLCLWECVRGDFSVCLPDCASFHFFCIFLAYFLQLLMRYVKTSTFSPCHGKEPPLEKLSTTSVQLMPLVSHMICFSQSVIHQYNSVNEY